MLKISEHQPLVINDLTPGPYFVFILAWFCIALFTFQLYKDYLPLYVIVLVLVLFFGVLLVLFINYFFAQIIIDNENIILKTPLFVSSMPLLTIKHIYVDKSLTGRYGRIYEMSIYGDGVRKVFPLMFYFHFDPGDMALIVDNLSSRFPEIVIHDRVFPTKKV